MTPLSTAIRKGARLLPANTLYYFNPEGTACDPFGAAYLGELREREMDAWWRFFHGASAASRGDYLFRSLMHAFPQLGSTVRAWPALAEELEGMNLLLRVRRFQTEYRQEIHASLWLVVDRMFRLGEGKKDIADLLQKHGL